MTISKRLRYEILRRDNNTCRYCGGTVPDVVLTIDHVIPQALGGTDEPSNLVAACKDCNAGKSADSPSAALVSDVSADAMRWSAAMQRAASLALDEIELTNRYVAEVGDAWTKWDCDGTIPRPGDWERSAHSWYSASVPVPLIADAIDLAMTNRRIVHAEVWRYACGIIWRRLSDMRETATALLATPTQAEPAGDADQYWRGYADCMDAPEVAWSVFQYAHLSAAVDGINYNVATV